MVAIGALVVGLNIGLLALTVAVTLHLAFPHSSGDAASKIAWGVVLLVCGIVTYVAALQRYGTIDAVGGGIASMATPLVAALLLCGGGPRSRPRSPRAPASWARWSRSPSRSWRRVRLPATGVVVALALSATIVDATPFSTVGALVVANAEEDERPRVYRGLLVWGAGDGGHGPGHRLAALHLHPVPLNGNEVPHENHAAWDRNAGAIAWAARAPAISSRSVVISW